MTATEVFESWAIVELFGHQQTAGKVTEQTIGGQGFVRVDVPTVGTNQGFTRFFGPGAIYSIIPTEEKVVNAFLLRNFSSPINPWLLSLPSPQPDDDDEDDPEVGLLAH
jgi:hypothetical protein